MDRATDFESDYLFEDSRFEKETYRQKRQWKRRRENARKNRKPQKPSTYIGQRTNCRPHY